MEAVSSISVNKKHKKSRKHPGKVRVKLPGIESYEKELEFTAEGPGRVIVRLERLMGSDRIRITDPKYLSTLVERLEAEETQAWTTRSRLRKKAEKNRSRQLAIEGLMEPAEDMQDLWNHPVFRVNRILNRLSVFDSHMTVVGATDRDKPLITQVDPFPPDDESGGVFKTFPGHNIFHHKELPFSRTSFTTRKSVMRKSTASGLLKRQTLVAKPPSSPSGVPQKEEPEATEQAEVEVSLEARATRVSVSDDDSKRDSRASLINLTASEAEWKKYAEDAENEDFGPARPITDKDGYPTTVHGFQRLYDIPSSENVNVYEPFRSDLVEMVYQDQGRDANEIYNVGEEVVGVYLRQQLTTEDFILKHGASSVLKNDKTKSNLALAAQLEGEIDTAEVTEEEEGSGYEEESEYEGGNETETVDEDGEAAEKAKEVASASEVQEELGEIAVENVSHPVESQTEAGGPEIPREEE